MSRKLKKITDKAGNTTDVVSWDGSGRPTEVQRVSGSGGSALTESFLSTYIASGTNAGLLDTVTQRESRHQGRGVRLRSTAYTYYDGTSGPGLAGELKLAVVKERVRTTIDTSYYRYYTKRDRHLRQDEVRLRRGCLQPIDRGDQWQFRLHDRRPGR